MVLTKQQIELAAAKISKSAEGGESLFLAVVLQAIRDLKPTKQGRDVVDPLREARKAWDWMTGRTYGFDLVCEYAGLEADYVLRVVKKIGGAL